MLMLLFLLALRNRNFYSKEQFFDKIYLFSKICIISLIYQGENYYVMAYYVILCFVLWMLNKYPKYKGPSKISEID